MSGLKGSNTIPKAGVQSIKAWVYLSLCRVDSALVFVGHWEVSYHQLVSIDYSVLYVSMVSGQPFTLCWLGCCLPDISACTLPGSSCSDIFHMTLPLLLYYFMFLSAL